MSTPPLAKPTGSTDTVVYWLFAASLLASLPYVQCLGDDTYIYMRLIDNLLDHGRLEYNPGEPCYGMTSVTWFFAWAAVKALTGSMDVSRYLISFAGHVLAFVGVLQLARRLIRDPVIVLCVVAAIVFDPFYLRWFWSGWEMSAKIAAAAWALLALIRCADVGAQGRPAFFAGLIVGLGALTRPEILVLAVFGVAYLLIARPSLRVLAAYGLGVLLVVGPWTIYAWHVFGWLVPHTIFAKTGTTPLDAAYLGIAAKRLAQILIGPQVAILAACCWGLMHMRPAFIRGLEHPLKFWAWPNELRTVLLVFGWGSVVFGYLVSGTYIESQKTGLFSPFLLIALAAWAQEGLARVTLKRVVLAAVLLGQIGLSLAIQQRLYYRYSIFNEAYRGGEDRAFLDFGRQVGRLTSPQDRIGLWELGVVGYFSGRYIIDFEGLATPELVRYKMREHGRPGYIEHFLADHGGAPTHIVDALPKDSPFTETQPREFFGASYVPIHATLVRRIGGRESDNSYYHFVLYKKAP